MTRHEDNPIGGLAMTGNQDNKQDPIGAQIGAQAEAYAPDDGPLSPDDLARIRIEAANRGPKGGQISASRLLPE